MPCASWPRVAKIRGEGPDAKGCAGGGGAGCGGRLLTAYWDSSANLIPPKYEPQWLQL